MSNTAKRTKIVIFSIILICIVMLLFIIPSRRVEGVIKSCNVVEGVSYIFTIVDDNGKEYNVPFYGRELRMGGQRCEIRRKNIFSKWEFERYITSSDESKK